MIKKKYFILLSASLLVLLLGLSTTSYADVNNTWTENQLKNIIYNYLNTKYTDAQMESYFSSHATEITNLVNKMNSNDYVYIQFQKTGPSTFYIGYGNTNSVWYRNVSNKRFYMTSSSGYKYWIMSTLINDPGWENSGYWNASEFNENYYYFSKPVYNNSNADTLYFAGGMYPETYWTGPYLDDYFTYSYNPDLTNIQVPNIYDPNELTTIKSMTYNDFVGEYVATVGMLKYLDYIQVTQAYWDNSISDWKLYRYNDNYITNNDFESTEPIEVKCPNGWWVGNTIIKFTCYPTWGNNVGDILEFWVYLVDNNTIINNGILQIGTFSGDYNNNMQNDLNNQLANERTDKVIDKMEELYNKMFTVSGEEIDKIISDTFENIQIESGEIAEVGAIMEYLQREPGDFVISWGSMTTHFTINGQNTSQLTIPANQINFSQMERDSEELHQVMTWERRIVSLAIFGLLVHEAYILFMATLGVGTYIYGHKLEEKNTLKKQQDAQEERWRSKLEEQRYNEWLRGHRN